MKQKTWIPLEKCEDGYLYIISARNARLGVFHEQEKGFVISRFKFSINSLFVEYHWDTGEPYGTVQPIEKIEKVPEKLWAGLKAGEARITLFGHNDEFQTYLNDKMIELKDRIISILYPDGPYTKIFECVWTEEGWVSKERAEKMAELKKLGKKNVVLVQKNK
jgi:hypothetical protein